jgi:hypothetical protein
MNAIAADTITITPYANLIALCSISLSYPHAGSSLAPAFMLGAGGPSTPTRTLPFGSSKSAKP